MTSSICRRLFVLLPLVVAGCSSSSTQPSTDAGGLKSDSGQMSTDSGGTPADSGMQNDSGSQDDSSTPTDSGPQDDGGVQTDGGDSAAPPEAGTDPVCTAPSTVLSDTCLLCLKGLTATNPCIDQFLSLCQGDTSCASFYECGGACQMGSSAADAGGGGYCVSTEGPDDAGTATQTCVDCCETQTPDGQSAYLADLVKTCVCAASAPCATACAM